MSYDDHKSGCVVPYQYLWARQHDSGETEGRKTRPTAVGFRFHRPKQEDKLYLFPVTTQPPLPDCWAVEIPEIEKRRAGLDPATRQWIVLDECNIEVIGQSFYLEPTPPIGRFSSAFFLPLMREVASRLPRGQVREVDRQE